MTRITVSSRRCVTGLILLLAIAVVSVSDASTVRLVGTNQLAVESELIFHGRVLERWSEPGKRAGTIVTRVKFAATEVLKGQTPGSSIVLTFLGGTLDGIVMDVEGSSIPGTGEEGIYFVERVNGNLVNPMYGWTQGHFIVDGNDGHVKTVAGAPVYGLQPQPRPLKLQISETHAKGVVIQRPDTHAVPLAAEAFKQRIRDLLDEVSR